MIPSEFSLEQNYPNPFNSNTVIKFSIPQETNVALNVYNVLGEKVIQLVSGNLDAGRYNFTWDAQNVVSGIYICELRTDNFIACRKMVLLR